MNWHKTGKLQSDLLLVSEENKIVFHREYQTQPEFKNIFQLKRKKKFWFAFISP